MADIFMSYARSDRDKVRGLIPILEAQGWTIFWDTAIEPGQHWDELIASELESARCIIVIWSQSSVLSHWVKDEATRGRERQVLVPVSIDGTRAPLGFRHVQMEFISEWSAPANEPALQRFLAGVRRVVSTAVVQDGPQAHAPAPTPSEPAIDPGVYWFDTPADSVQVVDYITECGDDFASTYAMAYLVATQPVDVGRSHSVPPGSILFLGVNDPHPRPSLDHYEAGLVTPFARAYTDKVKARRTLFAVPGYHRSDAAIEHFETLFCAARSPAARGTGLSFGGWDTRQRDPFFAVALPHKWWIWGVDLRYGQPLAPEQFNYFSLVAERMTSEDQIIICGPPDNWLLADFDDWTEQENLQKIIAIAEAAKARVAAIITGGRREYVHWAVPGKALEAFEIGGGRSFVYPSHRQPRRAVLRWPAAGPDITGGTAAIHSQAPRSPRRDRGRYEQELDFWFLSKLATRSLVEDVRLGIAKLVYWANQPRTAADLQARDARATAPGAAAEVMALFPGRGSSAVIGFRNLLFPFVNARFAFAIGCVYWLVTWQFQSLVTQYNISDGKIDALGIDTSLSGVLPYLPLYLLQAMIASVSMVFMLMAIYLVLVGYADGGRKAGLSGWLTKMFFGFGHFTTHVAAMFTLSLCAVQLANGIAPAIERELNRAYQSREERTPIVRDVIKDSLEPLQKRERAATPSEPQRSSPVREIVGFTMYPTFMVMAGGIVGGAVWGIYLAITGLIATRFAEKAFASLHMKGYRAFLRLRVEPEQLTIYAVGLPRFPSSRAWRKSREYEAPTDQVPSAPLRAGLIEKPIVIKAQRPAA